MLSPGESPGQALAGLEPLSAPGAAPAPLLTLTNCTPPKLPHPTGPTSVLTYSPEAW